MKTLVKEMNTLRNIPGTAGMMKRKRHLMFSPSITSLIEDKDSNTRNEGDSVRERCRTGKSGGVMEL